MTVVGTAIIAGTQKKIILKLILEGEADENIPPLRTSNGKEA
jgi:hypothetical protein